MIIEIDNLDPLRQRFINFRNLTLNAIDDFLGVFVDALENDAGDNFALPVFSDRALTNLVADFNPRDIAPGSCR